MHLTHPFIKMTGYVPRLGRVVNKPPCPVTANSAALGCGWRAE